MPTESEEFKQRDAASYDSVAEDFDAFVERFSAGFADRLIELAAVQPSQKVLDVGTGSGLVALRLAKRVGAGGAVRAIDLSDGMLAVAAQKALHAKLPDRLEFHRMDAENLEFEDGCFDAVVSLHALRHFPHPEKALSEMYRVLRPGGRVAIGLGSSAPLLSLHGPAAVARRVRDLILGLVGRQLVACNFLERLVQQLPGDPHGHEEAAWTHGSLSSHAIKDLLGAAGFTALSSEWRGQRALLDSAEDFWRLQVTFSSVARKRVRAASADAVEALRGEFLETCRRIQRRGGLLTYPTGTLFVCGVRPEH